MSGGGSIHSVAHIQFTHTYQDIISLENFLLAWKEFSKGKKSRKDVLDYSINFATSPTSAFDLGSEKSFS